MPTKYVITLIGGVIHSIDVAKEQDTHQAQENPRRRGERGGNHLADESSLPSPEWELKIFKTRKKTAPAGSPPPSKSHSSYANKPLFSRAYARNFTETNPRHGSSIARGKDPPPSLPVRATMWCWILPGKQPSIVRLLWVIISIWMDELVNPSRTQKWNDVCGCPPSLRFRSCIPR